MENKREKNLALEIMREAAADGEPVTLEEATEMARMELKAGGRYEQGEKKERKPRERKVDEEKKYLLTEIERLLTELGVANTTLKTETELTFSLGTNDYSIRLIKHRGKKK